jgi:hypothetical protein
MTSEEILALLGSATTDANNVANANTGQQFLDMINANKAEVQPIVDRIAGLKENINNTENAWMDYSQPNGMTIAERMLGRESATMPDRLDATKAGLNLAERTLTPLQALAFVNSNLSRDAEGAKAKTTGGINLGEMRQSKDDLQSKMDNAAADRAADAEARNIKAKGDYDAKYAKYVEDVTNYAIQQMGEGKITPEAAFGIIKSNVPDANDDKINLMLGMPAGFSGSVQGYYDSIGRPIDDINKEKATRAINKLIDWR